VVEVAAPWIVVWWGITTIAEAERFFFFFCVLPGPGGFRRQGHTRATTLIFLIVHSGLILPCLHHPYSLSSGPPGPEFKWGWFFGSLLLPAGTMGFC